MVQKNQTSTKLQEVIVNTEDIKEFQKFLEKQADKRINPQTLAQGIMNNIIFYTYPDTKDILVYYKGYYQPEGEVWIMRETKERLKMKYSKHIHLEVLEAIKAATFKRRNKFNTEPDMLNLENGLLDIETRELISHTPKFLSTVRIPISYDPNADCPAIKKFFGEIVSPKDVPLLEEIIGYCLDLHPRIQKVFLLVGSGHNGKSTFLSLLKAFLGAANCSHVDLQTLETDKFSSSELFGKLANLQADIPSITIRDTSRLKTLTGGDTIQGQKKFRDAFSFVNKAKLVFSANKPPKVIDETEAFWGRWIVIDFPNQFRGDKEDWYLLDKLTTPSELSGLLNIALNSSARLRERRQFSFTKSIETVRERYQTLSDPVYHYVRTCCEYKEDIWTPKIDIFSTFCLFANQVQVPTMTKKSFGLSLMRVCGDKVKSDTRTIDGTTIAGWRGLRIVASASKEEEE